MEHRGVNMECLSESEATDLLSYFRECSSKISDLSIMACDLKSRSIFVKLAGQIQSSANILVDEIHELGDAIVEEQALMVKWPAD